jgi:hypothetical protein
MKLKCRENVLTSISAGPEAPGPQAETAEEHQGRVGNKKTTQKNPPKKTQ